jgi:hypothetical protein
VEADRRGLTSLASLGTHVDRVPYRTEAMTLKLDGPDG